MFGAGESRNIKASFYLSNNGELHNIKATFIVGDNHGNWATSKHYSFSGTHPKCRVGFASPRVSYNTDDYLTFFLNMLSRQPPRPFARGFYRTAST